MAAPKPKKEADPYADWSEEDKADWEASAPQRERLKGEITDGIVDRLKDLFFNDPEGGEVTDPPEGEGAGAGDAGPVGDIIEKAVPFWDRQLFGRKGKVAG